VRWSELKTNAAGIAAIAAGSGVAVFIYPSEGARTSQVSECIDFEHHLSYMCKVKERTKSSQLNTSQPASI
jgi:hypothetical protein